MRESWFVVEVYCSLHLLLGPSFVKLASRDRLSIFVYLCSLVPTLLLAYLTFKGVRFASRLLALVIAVIPSLWVFAMYLDGGMDTYVVYGVACAAYFIIGAIKLWRIKVLPTRFTDPPSDSPAHS